MGGLERGRRGSCWDEVGGRDDGMTEGTPVPQVRQEAPVCLLLWFSSKFNADDDGLLPLRAQHMQITWRARRCVRSQH